MAGAVGDEGSRAEWRVKKRQDGTDGQQRESDGGEIESEMASTLADIPDRMEGA